VGAAADDDVVVDGDVEQLPRFHELPGEAQVFAARRDVTARVVVQQHDAGDAENPQRGAEDFARVDQGRGERARADLVRGDGAILRVEHQDPALRAGFLEQRQGLYSSPWIRRFG
jgi:hypothetical protein